MSATEFRQGVLYAIAAYFMWGFAPIYFKAVSSVPADEILMHRVIWSFWLCLALVGFSRGFGEVRQLLRSPRKLGTLVLTSVLVACNWLIFIWAVANDHMIDASLGYFINPLFSVALGMVFLGERMRPLQITAVVIAALGVVIQLVQYGSIPWISLALAISFGLYGLLRKQVNLKAASGLLVETAILLPVAAGYWFMLNTETANLSNNSTSLNVLLLAAGVITTLPLLAFAAAAVRIPLYLLGMLQYIGPSLMFLLAVLFYGEQTSDQQMTLFSFIWTALALLSWDGIKNARRNRRASSINVRSET